MITRRELLRSAAAGGVMAATGGCRVFTAAETHDQNLSVFLSDIHVACGGINTKWGVQPTYQNALFEKSVDAILAMRPLPARVVVFGDVALWFGWSQDYAMSKPGFERLEKAGIEVFLTTGNHDHRVPLFEAYPKQRQITPVPERVVSVIDLGTSDLLLLDTLYETGAKEGDGNAVGGAMDDAQFAWLADQCASRKRPFFCGAHHAARDLNGRVITKPLCESKFFHSWIHGHDHKVYDNWFEHGWGATKPHVHRNVVLPSSGWWGDIGWAEFRTFDDHAQLTYRINDFFFPSPGNPNQPTPKAWSNMVSEHDGRTLTFWY